MNYRLYKNKDKEFITLIGGLGSNISSWDNQIKLYKKHFSILVFDNLGSGKSDEPRDANSMELFADNTFEILNLLKIKKTHIVGKSMGGMIAQVLCSKYPRYINKLVLGCTAASRDNVGKEIIAIAKKIAKNVGLKELWFNALMLGYSRDYIMRNFKEYKNTEVLTNKKNLDGYLKQCKAIERLNNIKYLSRIKCETLIVYGKNDLIVDVSKSHELAKLIKNTQTISFPGGHGFWKENGDLVDQEIIDFLIN